MSEHSEAPASRTGPRRTVGLLIGIAVVVLVFAGPVPWLREQVKRANCEANFEALGAALRTYADDHDGEFPPDLRVLVNEDYLATTRVYVCPNPGSHGAAGEEAVSADAGKHCDCAYVGCDLKGLGSPYEAPRTVLMHDLPDHHRGFYHILFADGSVKGYAGDSIEAIVKREKLILPGNLGREPEAEQPAGD